MKLLCRLGLHNYKFLKREENVKILQETQTAILYAHRDYLECVFCEKKKMEEHSNISWEWKKVKL
jgi:hypothetical protein